MTERILLLGTAPLARKLVTELSGRAPGRYAVLGVISEARGVDFDGFDCPCLGTLEDLQQILADQAPGRIIVAMKEQYGHLPADRLVETQAGRNLVVETGVDAYERLTGKLAIESLTSSAALFSSEFRPARWALWLARASSVLASCLGLVLCLPLLGLIAVLIRLESAGPALFVQDRVGLGGRRFELLKFRSMKMATGTHTEWAVDNADRITGVGRWIRKYRLDELPQFINVIRGDMNLVGPRPHPVINRELFILVSRNMPQCGEQIPYYSLRSTILPGITGWAQVRYKYANGLDEEIEKLRYDLYYIKHYSLLLDLRILFETVKVMLLGHGKLEPTVTTGLSAEGRAQATEKDGTARPGLPDALLSRSKPESIHVSERGEYAKRRRFDSGSLSRTS